MAEFFENDYVVRVESGHPGYTSYQIIATEAGWRQLIADLQHAIAHPPPPVAVTTPQGDTVQVDIADREGAAYLLEKYATIAGGQTSRVTLTFYLAKDLRSYHVHPKRWTEWREWLTCGALILLAGTILLLAGIGFLHLYGDFFKSH